MFATFSWLAILQTDAPEVLQFPPVKIIAQPPAYREAGKVYYADSCRPLVEAAESGKVRLAALSRGGYPGRRMAATVLPGLRSVGCWDAHQEQTWGLPSHRNEGIEISFLASGQMPATIEKHRQELRHDEFMITRPWQPHQLGNPNIGPGKLIWLIVDVCVRRPHQPWRWPSWIVLSPDDLAALTRFLRQNEQYVWPGTADLRRCFLGVAQAVEQDHDGSSASLLAVMINELLLVLLGMFRDRKIPLRASLTSTARTVRLFLDELQGAVDQPWTVETMAESCHLGVTQFVHYCEKLTNMSPAQYLRQARITKAREQLTGQPERSITEIALDCGFSSSQYFANVFRQVAGVTPRDYRQKHLN